jgi:hypothetical protein
MDKDKTFTELFEDTARRPVPDETLSSRDAKGCRPSNDADLTDRENFARLSNAAVRIPRARRLNVRA